MNCERARESFSDYIEGSLDRRSTVAVEGHLSMCRYCAADVAALRRTWTDLGSVPSTPPPLGLLEVTIAAVRREHDRSHAVSPPRPSVFDWLRSLSPARVAMATGLATLIVAGAFIAPQFFGVPFGSYVSWSELIHPQRETPASVDLSIAYGSMSSTTQVVDISLRASKNVPDTTAELQEVQPVKSNEFQPAGHGTLVAGKPYDIPINLPRGPATAGLIVKVVSLRAGYSHDFYCAIPPAPVEGGARVSMTLVDTPLQDAVYQLAEKTGRPVVLDAALGATPVTASVSDASAAEAWNAVLRPLRLRAVETDGAYHVVSTS